MGAKIFSASHVELILYVQKRFRCAEIRTAYLGHNKNPLKTSRSGGRGISCSTITLKTTT